MATVRGSGDGGYGAGQVPGGVVIFVEQLWRYPVKSLGGESLEAVEVAEHGLVGDRRFGIVDLDTGTVLTARRVPELLFATARWSRDPHGDPEAGSVRIEHADGRDLTDDEALSDWLGRAVALRRAGAEGGVYENPSDPFAESGWQQWQGPGHAWHDSSRTRVSLVSTATLGSWDPRRFRANVVLGGAGRAGEEDALVGARVSLGAVGLDVRKQVDRCVMVTRAQPGLERDLDVLRSVHRDRAGSLAVGALVEVAGRVAVGDRLVAMA